MDKSRTYFRRPHPCIPERQFNYAGMYQEILEDLLDETTLNDVFKYADKEGKKLLKKLQGLTPEDVKILLKDCSEFQEILPDTKNI